MPLSVSPLPPSRFALRFPYDPALVTQVKAVPGMKWEPGIRAWTGYADAITAAAARCQFNWTPPMPAAMSGCLAKGPALRPYQELGAEFCLVQGPSGALLADDMGLGKSAQALAAAQARGRRAVIVCPSYVRGVWCRPGTGELARWWPAAVVHQPKGTKPQPPPPEATVCVLHYDILHAWAPTLASWLGDGALILDECHFLQNDKSRRSKAARELAATAGMRIGLSGTPLTNRPRNLWNIVDTLSPGRFGSFFAFAKEFCGAHQDRIDMRGGDVRVVWDFDGSSNEAELKRRLSYFMLRRTKAEVQLALPKRTRQVIEIEVAAKYRPRPSVEMVRSKSAVQGALAKAADGKLSEVAALVQDHAAAHKVVVFCWRRAVADALASGLAEEGIQAYVAHGGLSQAQRDTALGAAAASSTPCVVCCTIDTCGSGIDLSFADVAVFAELTYEPHELLQAEARFGRAVGGAPVLIQYVIAKNSIDELVADTIVSKLGTFEQVIGATGSDLELDLGHSQVDAMQELLNGLRSSGA